MKPSFLCFNVLGFVLAIVAFMALANCSGTEDTPFPSSDSSLEVEPVWCIYSSMQMCFYDRFTECPGDGILARGCPYSSSSNGSGSGTRQNYCIYPLTQQCLQGTFTTECPGDGGVVALGCPYSSAGGTAPSSPSTGASSSSGRFAPSSPSTGASSSSGTGGGGLSSSTGSNPPPPASTAGPVACYGELKVNGNKLVGSKTGDNNPVQVRGVSLFWSNTGWGGERFFDATTVNAMVDSWRAEIIRAPMGYSESGGYKTDPSNKTRVEAVVDAAIAKGVYVIIDWHSHNAHNETTAAKAFFIEMAQKYGSYDNVIFEIYNEPLCSNGASSCAASGRTTWAEIKTYANEIIPAIRQYSDNLVLVGTPNWDQDVNVVTSSTKLSYANVAYVLHFYAAEHPLSGFQSKANSVLSAGLPLFVSEYGTVMASGDGTHSAANTNTWMTYLDNNKISSCAWSVNDKTESSSFFGVGGTFNKTGWTTTSNMTASGQYVYNKLTSSYASAPWRTCSFPEPPPPGESTNCQIGSHCYEMSASDCSLYGTPSTCTKTTLSCGEYCLWDTGCSEIATDPAGVYGQAYTTCAAAISVCDTYSEGRFSNSTCNGNTSSSYCYNYDRARDCVKIGSSCGASTISSQAECVSYGGSVETRYWCYNSAPYGIYCE